MGIALIFTMGILYFIFATYNYLMKRYELANEIIDKINKLIINEALNQQNIKVRENI